MKTQKNSKKQYEKVVLIVCCVLVAVSTVLFIFMAVGLPSLIDSRQSMQYLYENGVEVDAHIKGYYDDYKHEKSAGHYINRWRGCFHIIYEYIDADGKTYTDEYLDPVVCRSKDELSAREQEIKQTIATDGKTMKMLIADNGLCCLSVYKESLISSKTLALGISLLVISSVVLGLCIFGIVRQSKKLKKFKRYYN